MAFVTAKKAIYGIYGVVVHLYVSLPILQRRTTFLTSCLRPWTVIPFQNRTDKTGNGTVVSLEM